jgi:hypothetical protein
MPPIKANNISTKALDTTLVDFLIETTEGFVSSTYDPFFLCRSKKAYKRKPYSPTKGKGRKGEMTLVDRDFTLVDAEGIRVYPVSLVNPDEFIHSCKLDLRLSRKRKVGEGK